MPEHQAADNTAFIEAEFSKRLAAYEANPSDIREHYEIEQSALGGAYSYRQIIELVQNAADAIGEDEQASRGEKPRIEIRLQDDWLIAANTGKAFTRDGVQSLLHAHVSTKRGEQIGRFGIGFKSLLSLGGPIEIMSTDWALLFDPQKCRALLKERFQVDKSPALRLIWSLDPSRVSRLKSLYPWATTVIAAKIERIDVRRQLEKEIQDFPSEFMLFCREGTELLFDDSTHQGGSGTRQLRIRREDPHIVLSENNQDTSWIVDRWKIRVDNQQAHDDASHIHARDLIEASWARRAYSQSEQAGNLWAYFPTQTPSSLPGVLQAPWKLNSDRSSIIAGPWNTAVMQAVAPYIARAIAATHSDADPGAHFDLFPRQVERASEVVQPLVEAIWDSLATEKVLPDGNGIRQSIVDLYRHPTDDYAIVSSWEKIADELAKGRYVHSSCLKGDRTSRLDRLAKLVSATSSLQQCPRLFQATPNQWLEAIASTMPVRAADVIRLAGRLIGHISRATFGAYPQTRPLADVAFIPDSGGNLATPSQIVLGTVPVLLRYGERAPAEWLDDQSNLELQDILVSRLHVQKMNDGRWLALLNEKLSSAKTNAAPMWEVFWTVLRRAPRKLAVDFLKINPGSVLIRRRDRTWVDRGRTLFPGALVNNNTDDPNTNLLVDAQFHQEDRDFLDALGVSETPEVQHPCDLDLLPHEWLSYWRTYYRQHVKSSAKWGYLLPSQLDMPVGYKLLAELHGNARAKLTRQLLNCLVNLPKQVQFGHDTTKSYSKISVDHPLRWWLRMHGAIQNEGKSVSLAAFVSRSETPTLRKSSHLHELAAAAREIVRVVPEVSVGEEAIRCLWHSFLSAASVSSAGLLSSLAALWRDAADDSVIPEYVEFGPQRVPLNQVYATTDPVLARHLLQADVPIVLLDSSTLSLWTARGAIDAGSHMEVCWDSEETEVMLLQDYWPDALDIIKPECAGVACRIAPKLRVKLGTLSISIPALVSNGQVLIDPSLTVGVAESGHIGSFVDALANGEMLRVDHVTAKARLDRSAVDRARRDVREATTLADRLWRASGRRPEVLKAILGRFGDESLLSSLNDQDLAELVITQMGPASLPAIRDAMEAANLQPPGRWGSEAAKAFVSELGFPAEFAESAEARRDPEKLVPGPVVLNPLHEYQTAALAEVLQALDEGAAGRRALLSLPTGAGKTRVAVELAVSRFLAHSENHRLVIWVAQTDELCEQAVRTFDQVWRHSGAIGQELRICRLWGSNENPAKGEEAVPTVVVASIQTLSARLSQPMLQWMKSASLLVIDECHHATARSYTRLLDFFDLSADALRRGATPTTALVGLSATPFRTDPEESLWLKNRFGGIVVPREQSVLFDGLLARGVLSRIRVEEIRSDHELTSEEVEKLGSLDYAVDSFEIEQLLEAVNSRMGRIIERTGEIVSYLKQCEAQSVLLFANSVEHSKELALRLQIAGVQAAAIDGTTSTTSRRYFLNRFQNGEIRVLCNYNVLSTGFDAPRTDMVMITRVVMSPVRFAQMVGRGLRGPSNGGTDVCRLVTVMDNLLQFREHHAVRNCLKYFATTSDGLAGT
jgi:superfamily II DNA or RNA helicase